jgi:hypothetical protein
VNLFLIAALTAALSLPTPPTPAPAVASEWAQTGYGPGLTFYNPYEKTLTPSSVGAIRSRWEIATHGAPECLDACEALALLLYDLLDGTPRDEALQRLKRHPLESPGVQSIIEGSYLGRTAANVWASGYVLQTFEAALWSFHTTENFRDAILAAVNLGEDADTTGAVCGQIAGACYGVSGIPIEWLDRLAMRAELETMALQLSVRISPQNAGDSEQHPV